MASEIPLSVPQLGLGGPFSPADVSRLPLQSLLCAGSPSFSPESFRLGTSLFGLHPVYCNRGGWWGDDRIGTKVTEDPHP